MSTPVHNRQYRCDHRRRTSQNGALHTGYARPPGGTFAATYRTCECKGNYKRRIRFRRAPGGHSLLCGGVDREIASSLATQRRKESSLLSSPVYSFPYSFLALKSRASGRPAEDSKGSSESSATSQKVLPRATRTLPYLSYSSPDPYLYPHFATSIAALLGLRSDRKSTRLNSSHT